MRTDRGFFCFPEVDLGTGLPLTAGMSAVIDAKLSRAVAHEAIITGQRIGAPEAVTRGMVHEALPETEVLPRAVEVARSLAGKHRPTMGALKRGMFASALDMLSQPLPEFVAGR
jgi:enoyl-CoA hydratase/carnithine racemase